MKKEFKLIVILLFCIFSGGSVHAQTVESIDSTIVISGIRYPESVSQNTLKEYPIKDTVARLMSQSARKLGLYDILFVIQQDSVFWARGDSAAALIPTQDDILDFTEVVIVEDVLMSQKGVPPEKGDYFVFAEKSASKRDNLYPKNVRTEISVLSSFLAVEDGQVLGPFDFQVIHTGGTKEKSKEKALDILKLKIKNELKRIYWLSADIDSVEDKIIWVSFPEKRSAKKKQIFELVEPDRIKREENLDVLGRGGVVGYATFMDTLNQRGQLEVLRLWQQYYPGSWIVVQPVPMTAVQIDIVPPITNGYRNLGLYFHAAAIQDFDMGLGLNLFQITDSRNENDIGFGFGGFLIGRFLNGIRFDLGAKFGVDIDFPFKKDDDGRVVSAFLPSAHIGLLSELLLSKNSDFVLNAGYRLGLKTDKWQYSEDDESISAFWQDESPELHNSGFFISVGIKYLIF